MASSFEPLFTSKPDVPAADAAAPAWFETLGNGAGFAEDPRFGLGSVTNAQSELDEALEQAFAAGAKKAREDTLAQLAQTNDARTKLGLSLSRMDDDMQDQLAARLAETVAALCEAALAPMALDRDALQKRCIAAAGRVGDGIIDASLCLHPDDIELLDRDFAATWHIIADPDLERGSVKFDMPEGAVVDGPAEWRTSLHEALGLC